MPFIQPPSFQHYTVDVECPHRQASIVFRGALDQHTTRPSDHPLDPVEDLERDYLNPRFFRLYQYVAAALRYEAEGLGLAIHQGAFNASCRRLSGPTPDDDCIFSDEQLEALDMVDPPFLPYVYRDYHDHLGEFAPLEDTVLTVLDFQNRCRMGYAYLAEVERRVLTGETSEHIVSLRVDQFRSTQANSTANNLQWTGRADVPNPLRDWYRTPFAQADALGNRSGNDLYEEVVARLNGKDEVAPTSVKAEAGESHVDGVAARLDSKDEVVGTFVKAETDGLHVEAPPESSEDNELCDIHIRYNDDGTVVFHICEHDPSKPITTQAEKDEIDEKVSTTVLITSRSSLTSPLSVQFFGSKPETVEPLSFDASKDFPILRTIKEDEANAEATRSGAQTSPLLPYSNLSLPSFQSTSPLVTAYSARVRRDQDNEAVTSGAQRDDANPIAGLTSVALRAYEHDQLAYESDEGSGYGGSDCSCFPYEPPTANEVTELLGTKPVRSNTPFPREGAT